MTERLVPSGPKRSSDQPARHPAGQGRVRVGRRWTVSVLLAAVTVAAGAPGQSETTTHPLILSEAGKTDLVGYWTFDEGRGDLAVDWSGHGQHAVLGGATWDSQGRQGGGVAFNGTNSLVEIPDGVWNQGAPLTIMLWCKPRGVVAGTLAEHRFGGATPGVFAVQWAGGVVQFAGYDSAKLAFHARTPVAAPTGAWTHAAITITDSQLAVYHNGELAQTAPITNAFPKISGPLFLGGRGSVGDAFFNGVLDEVAIYRRSLTAEEIQAAYQRYAAGAPLVAGLEDVVIGAVQLPRRFYRRGESDRATVIARNFAAAPRTVTVTLQSLSWLATERRLAAEQLTFAPGETRTLELPFTLAADSEEFGCEVEARSATHRHGMVIGVADNAWAIGIGGHLHPADYGRAPLARIDRGVREQAEAYANWLEWFFWAADEWGDLTPTNETWYSGQASYPMQQTNLRRVIDQAHAHGLKIVTYGKHVGCGPEGWDLARRHPDWFLQRRDGQPDGFWNVFDLDHWHDSARRQAGWRPTQGWCYIAPDFRQASVLDYGIRAILDSAREYGWDGVRYDGHYTAGNDALSAWNMRRLKETVWTERPGFLFGFNYAFEPGSAGLSHEMREAMAGGGLWMQEAIGSWGYSAGGARYITWEHYATNELAAAHTVRQAGGHYHCIWRTDGTPAGLYKLIYGLIAGGHPVYGGYQGVIGCGNWGRFMTRWSAFLWHPRLEPVTNAAAQVRVTVPGDRRVDWAPLMQEVVADARRLYKIVHLVNPPPSNVITQTTLPAAIRNIQVALTAPRGTRVTRAVLVRPEHEPNDLELPRRQRGRATTVTVPEIQHWGMLIFELSGRFNVPVEPPRFAEPTAPAAVAAGRAIHRQSSADPLEPVADIALSPVESLWESDHGYWSLPNEGTADPDARNGRAQLRARGQLQAYLGRTAIGPLPPGRYIARMRLKLEDDAPPVERQQFSTWTRYHLAATSTVTSAAFDTQPANTNVTRLIVGGQYHEYFLPPIELYETAHVSIAGLASCREPADNRALLDHIILSNVVQYTDADLADRYPVTKPAGLRAPQGAAPSKVMLVKGLYWQQYNVPAAVACDERYDLPASYEELYAYDAVVCANFDFSATTYAVRRMLRDWVEDGGRLVLLGGPMTFGVGGMSGTYQAAALPFHLRGAGEITHCATGTLLGPQPGVPYPGRPALFWRHAITAKDGVRIEAYAGNDPVAARQPAGAGEVVAFVGTVQGDPPAGVTPFWETEAWRDLLRQLVRGASGAPTQPQSTPAPETKGILP